MNIGYSEIIAAAAAVALVFSLVLNSQQIWELLSKIFKPENKVTVSLFMSNAIRKEINKKIKWTSAKFKGIQKQTTFVFIGAPDFKSKNEIFMNISICIKNHGAKAAENLALTIEHPIEFEFDDESYKKIKAEGMKLHEDSLPKSFLIYNYIQLCQEIDVIRRDDGIVVGIPIRVKPHTYQPDTQIKITNSYSKMVNDLLSKSISAINICPARFYVSSKNTKRINGNVILVFISAASHEELEEEVKKVISHMWKEAFGSARRIWKYPWEKVTEKYQTVLIQPDYQKIDYGNILLMDDFLTTSSMSIGEIVLPHERPYGALHEF